MSAGMSGALPASDSMSSAAMTLLSSLLLSANSSDDSNVIAAHDTLSEAGKAPLIPALILYHPSADVAAHAPDLLAATSRTDYLPLLDNLLVHPNAALR